MASVNETCSRSLSNKLNSKKVLVDIEQKLVRLSFKERQSVFQYIWKSKKSDVRSINEISEKYDWSDFLAQLDNIKETSVYQRWKLMTKVFLKNRLSLPSNVRALETGTTAKKILSMLKQGTQFLGQGLMWLISPIPFDLQRKKSKVYVKIRKDPDYVLSDKESQYIKKMGFEKDLAAFRNAVNDQSTLEKVKNGVQSILRTTLSRVPRLASFVLMFSLVDMTEVKSSESYLKELITNTESRSRVELILDTSYFPHTSIRIDNTVYNPSQQTLMAFPVQDYLKKGHSIRTIATLELVLSDSEVSNLKKVLESNLWKNYFNVSGFYDCTTVIADAIQATTDIYIPPAVDASPSAMMSWMRLQGFWNQESVGDFDYVRTNEDLNFVKTSSISLKDGLIRSLEAKLFLLLAPQIIDTQKQIRQENLFWESEAFDQQVSEMSDIFLKVYKYDSYIARQLSSIRVKTLKKSILVNNPEMVIVLDKEISEIKSNLIYFLEAQRSGLIDDSKDLDRSSVIRNQVRASAISRLIAEINEM